MARSAGSYPEECVTSVVEDLEMNQGASGESGMQYKIIFNFTFFLFGQIELGSDSENSFLFPANYVGWLEDMFTSLFWRCEVVVGIWTDQMLFFINRIIVSLSSTEFVGFLSVSLSNYVFARVKFVNPNSGRTTIIPRS